MNWSILNILWTYSGKTWLEFGSAKPVVVRSDPPMEDSGKGFIEKMQKQNKEIIWLTRAQAVALFGKDSVVCDWLFLPLRYLTLA